MNEPILVQALAALAPVREHLVVVGGTAHRLFPLHVYGEALDHELLTTEDVDLAAPLQLAQAGGEDLAARLRAAGFEAEVRGAEEPCHRYRFGQTIATLQFIAPLQGSGLKRSGQRDRSLRFSGIVAEKLRSVELLLDAPWPLELDEKASATIHVVNPLAFLAQKLLVLPTRPLAKRGKDALYVYDTLTIFADHLQELRAERDALLPRCTMKQKRSIDQVIERFFGAVGDAVREAVRIAEGQRDDPPSADALARAGHDGLTTLFRGAG